MHNTLARLQNTFGYLTSCAFALALAISALSLLPLDPITTTTSSQAPTADISVRNIQVVRGRPHYYSPKREEYAHIRFDLDADLSPLFNWNTKQVFVYLSAEYPTQQQQQQQNAGSGEDGREQGSRPLTTDARLGMNKAVIWDTIIPAPASKWSLANVRERYYPARGTKAAAGKGKRRDSAASKSGREKGGAKTTDIAKPGLLSLKNQKPKYQITDPSGAIASRPNATLTLSWNVQPWVGPLLWDKGMLEDKSGVGGAQGSWNLPFLKHPWRGGVLPRSETFDFPPLKGSQKTSEVVMDKDGPKTPEPASVEGMV
jgi:signal peptidase complex subunit 3